MSSVRGRGRGGRGGGGDGSQKPRGSWRGGPPGSNGNGNGTGASRANSPIITGTPTNSSKQTLEQHFADLKVVDDKARKAFQTDADISGSTGPKQRELKPWSAGPVDPNQNQNQNQNRNKANGNGAHREAETFGPVPTGAWDQFETHKRLFGTESTWDENLYTTRLDKSAPDYKKKEREADRLAAEIMGQTASNPHIAEERNQAIKGAKEMDEEEKYSGVARNPNAYVPPAARKSQGSWAAAAAAKPNGGVTPAAPAVATPAPAPAPAPTTSQPAAAAAAAASSPAAPAMAPSASNNALSVAPPSANAGLSPPAQPTRSTSDGPSAPAAAAAPTAAPLPEKPVAAAAAAAAAPAEATTMTKTESKNGAGAVDSFRRFVGTERERAEAKKQSIQKSERERQLADLKKFKDSFKVALPVPKDMLPILAKDEAKQKEIEARAAQTVLEEQRANEAKKLMSPKGPSGQQAKSPMSAKKMAMKIQPIPSFDALKKKKPQPPTLAVPETAKQDIALGTSPPASDTSTAVQPAPKLNPKATTFSFKPNPSATAFTPGGPSSAVLPAATSATAAHSAAAPVAAPTAPATERVVSPAAGPSNVAPQVQPHAPIAGPSNGYKNPFFSSKPRPVAVNLRDDFFPWRHGQTQPAHMISPQWPFTGRKYTTGYPMNGPHPHMEDEMMVGPGPMPGMQPQFPPYYRYQQGMPPAPGMVPGSPMFSPGHGYAPLPGQGPPMHMGGPPQPNGMPMYYPNGMPPPPFMPPHPMHYNPQMGRPGPGPGPHQGPQGGPMPKFYQNPPQQLGTPHQTPLGQSNLPFPPPGPYGTIPPNAGPPPHHQQHHQQPQQPPPMAQSQSNGGVTDGSGPSPGSQGRPS